MQYFLNLFPSKSLNTKLSCLKKHSDHCQSHLQLDLWKCDSQKHHLHLLYDNHTHMNWHIQPYHGIFCCYRKGRHESLVVDAKTIAKILWACVKFRY